MIHVLIVMFSLMGIDRDIVELDVIIIVLV